MFSLASCCFSVEPDLKEHQQASQSNQQDIEEKEPKYDIEPGDIELMSRRMSGIRTLVRMGSGSGSALDEPVILKNTTIKKVCLIVVVDAEVQPIMDIYKFSLNKKLSNKFLNLGTVSSGKIKKLHVDIVKVAQSKLFKRHYSGYTQASALAALVSSIINPDIVISFGTAGGMTRLSKKQMDSKNGLQSVEIGEVIFGEACLFLDRLRTRSKNAFDWGLWGGKSLQADHLAADLSLVKGVVASQIGYMITDFQSQMIDNADVIALDMECAPIAQILNQTNINFIALKVISNGIYPGNPEKMESEYHDNREMVSKKATQILIKVVDYLNGKRISDL